MLELFHARDRSKDLRSDVVSNLLTAAWRIVNEVRGPATNAVATQGARAAWMRHVGGGRPRPDPAGAGRARAARGTSRRVRPAGDRMVTGPAARMAIPAPRETTCGGEPSGARTDGPRPAAA
jgi:hypothetical protein